jgi:hypothetical protein
LCTGHDKRSSLVNIPGIRVARAHVPCKWIGSGLTIPPEVLAPGE